MTSFELKKQIELWSLVTALFIITMIIVGFILFIFVYVSTDKIEEKSETVIVQTESFGIVTQQDIYTEKLDMSKYTSHGRLKYGQ